MVAVVKNNSVFQWHSMAAVMNNIAEYSVAMQYGGSHEQE